MKAMVVFSSVLLSSSKRGDHTCNKMNKIVRLVRLVKDMGSIVDMSRCYKSRRDHQSM